MADWAKFAKLLGMAQYGDDVRAVEQRKRKEGIEAEELGFKRSANNRAESAAYREAEEAEYGKGRRKTKEEADRLALERARLGNVGAEQDISWEAGRSERDAREAARADRAEKRQAAQLGISQEELKLRKAAAERESQMDAERLSSAQRQNRIGQATEQSEIDVANERTDPKVRDSQRLAQLVQLYKAVDPDSEDAEYIMQQIKALTADQKVKQLDAANGANPDADPLTPQNVVRKWGFK